jgi:hypothetical protein
MDVHRTRQGLAGDEAVHVTGVSSQWKSRSREENKNRNAATGTEYRGGDGDEAGAQHMFATA